MTSTTTISKRIFGQLKEKLNEKPINKPTIKQKQRKQLTKPERKNN